MAYKIVADIVDPDGTIKVSHTFWGRSGEAEAREYLEHHLETCEYFSAAMEEGRVIEEGETVDESELPEAEEMDEGEGESADGFGR